MEESQNYDNLRIIRYLINPNYQSRHKFIEYLSNIDWNSFYSFCNNQWILGSVFCEIKGFYSIIPLNIYTEWNVQAEFIKETNKRALKCLKKIVYYLDRNKIRFCILKGQDNVLIYPNSQYRSPGDIDIWVEGNTEDIIQHVLAFDNSAHYSINHIVTHLDEFTIEVHYYPTYLSNWCTMRKLSNYINDIKNSQFSNKVKISGIEVAVLTDDFNIVVQLLHMYLHFFSTRNNFKQFFDFFYLLKKLDPSHKDNCLTQFKRFQVVKYAEGIMWIMADVLGMEDNYIIGKKDEKIGQLILAESFKFGKYSYNRSYPLFRQCLANIKLFKFFPLDVTIRYLFLIWHQWWKYKLKVRLYGRK